VQYENRAEAGRSLAEELTEYSGRSDVVVLALPRGGLPIASEIASALHAPLDVFVVRKLGVPGHEELAMGAIATGGVRVMNTDVVRELQLPDDVIESVAAREQKELERREWLYRGDRPLVDLSGKIVIVVDDGLATGATMRAAVAALRHMKPGSIVIAVPVGSIEVTEEMRSLADEVICPYTPEPFRAVGLWYQDFSQASDKELQAMLDRSLHPEASN
jgi:predicted phosphoribosyltransferase